MTSAKEKPNNQSVNFLRTIFSDTLNIHKGYIEIRIRGENYVFKSHFCSTIDQVFNNLPYDSQADIYFGVAPRQRRSGKKESINFVTCIWTDIDYGKIGHKKPSKYASKEEAIEAIAAFPIPPSYIVSSGNGLHVYWLLKTIASDIQRIEACHKELIRLLGGDPGTHNVDRVLRVPGTVNFKDPENIKNVEIIASHPEYKYSLEDFEFITLEKAPLSLEEKLLHLTTKARTLIETGTCENYNYLSRSEADFKVICEMVRACWTDSEIEQVFDTFPIGEKHHENPSYLKYTIQKCRKKVIPFPEGAIVDGKVAPAKVAQWLIDRDMLIFTNNRFYEYEQGYYQPLDDKQIGKNITDALQDGFGNHMITNILSIMKMKSFKAATLVNTSPLLNLNNGLLDPHTLTLHPPNPENISTIRVNVSFDPNARCPFFERTLAEIFMNDIDKIETFLEFAGLCLTQDTRYQKCLFLVGEGANGKSVLLNTIKNLLGSGNCSTIPLEKFANNHYLAGLFGKLANICLEAPSRGEMADSMFKAIVSGEEITADHKHAAPFQFKPHCKLLFAVNHLPRVDDKSDGYFRRLLILRCQKQFSPQEQNKNLENELKKELPGIMNLALLGLKRLNDRGDFRVPRAMELELEEYRKENNTARLFIEEECQIAPHLTVAIKDLYYFYSNWCKESGYRALSKKSLGIEIKRAYPKIIPDRKGSFRFWKGFSLLSTQASSNATNEKCDEDDIFA